MPAPKARRFERFAVLAVLVASPWWLPALPGSMGGGLRATVVDTFRPLFEAIHVVRTGVGRFTTGIVRGPFLLEQNRYLKEQLAVAGAHEEIHRQLAQENERLRRMLDFKSNASWKTVPAQVIARELGIWSRTLLINKGSRDGIASGMAVVTPTGLVGRIGEVGSSSSRVILVSDPHFRVAAVLTGSRVSGLLVGNPSGEITLTYIPLQAAVQPGERVSTSGGKSFCPPDVPVGTVLDVREDPSRLFRSARVRTSVTLAAVEEVLVIERLPSE